jgi:hypothetical protein
VRPISPATARTPAAGDHPSPDSSNLLCTGIPAVKTRAVTGR